MPSEEEKDRLVERALMTCEGRRMLRETIRKTGSNETIIMLTLQCCALAIASGNKHGELDCKQMIIETLDEGADTMSPHLVEATKAYLARSMRPTLPQRVVHRIRRYLARHP
jgi:hypothetical protein